jgi:hypothetical protein
MASPGDPNESASRLLFTARQFLDFATTSPIDEPDRLLKLIRLLDALNGAHIEFEAEAADSPRVPGSATPDDLRDRWPELDVSYPIDANGDARESGDGRREVFHASAFVDLKAICFAIYEATSVADLSNDQAGAEHLAWSYELHWISHAHDLRRFLARRILKQRPS